MPELDPALHITKVTKPAKETQLAGERSLAITVRSFQEA